MRRRSARPTRRACATRWHGCRRWPTRRRPKSRGWRPRSGAAERLAVTPRQLDIVKHPGEVHRLLLVAQVADIFGRPPRPELAGGDAFAGRQHGARGEHAAALDLAAVHDDGAQADEAAVVEDAAVDHGNVAD